MATPEVWIWLTDASVDLFVGLLRLMFGRKDVMCDGFCLAPQWTVVAVHYSHRIIITIHLTKPSIICHLLLCLDPFPLSLAPKQLGYSTGGRCHIGIALRCCFESLPCASDRVRGSHPSSLSRKEGRSWPGSDTEIRQHWHTPSTVKYVIHHEESKESIDMSYRRYHSVCFVLWVRAQAHFPGREAEVGQDQTRN